MSATDLFRTALFGSPPQPNFKPSRELALAAFRDVAVSAQVAVNGFVPYESVTALNADSSKPVGTLAYVYRNNGSATDAANGFYQRTGSVWERADWLIDVISDGAINGAFSGPLSGRPQPAPRNGFRYHATDLDRTFQWVEAGSPNPMPPFTNATVTGYVGLYRIAELKNLAIDFTNILPSENVAELPSALLDIQAASRVRLGDFRATLLSASTNPKARLSWSQYGLKPDSQVVSWDGYSIPLDGGVTELETSDWTATLPLFIYGNSLSDITDVTTRWSQVLAASLGVGLNSVARYSSDVRQVKRAGLEPLMLTIGSTLSAGGTYANVTHIDGLAVTDPTFLSSPQSILNTGDPSVVTGVSMGGLVLAGAEVRHATLSISNAAATNYRIVQDAGQPALALTGPVQFVPDVALARAGSRSGIWVGQNYYYSGVPNSYGDHTNPQMFIDIAKMVGAAKGGPAFILPIIPNANWPAEGSPIGPINGVEYGFRGRAAMAAANARLEALYPNLYLRNSSGQDLNAWLQSHGDGSANDNADIAAGYTPRSLRLSGDGLHLNAAGDALVAQFVEDALAVQDTPPAITDQTGFSLVATGTQQRQFPEDPIVSMDSAVTRATTGFEAQLVDEVEQIKQSQASGAPYYPSRAAGVAALDPGQFFTSNETGETRYYEVTSTNPFYADRGRVSEEVTKATVGLANVDNTADLAKPVSTAQQAALDEAVRTDYFTSATGKAVPAPVRLVRLEGYDTTKLGIDFVQVSVQPTHAAKFQAADGRWFEIAEPEIRPEMFGCKGDDGTFTGTNDKVGMKLAVQVAAAIRRPLVITRAHYIAYSTATDPINLTGDWHCIIFRGGRIRYGGICGLPLFYNQNGIGSYTIENPNIISDYTIPLAANRPQANIDFINSLNRGSFGGIGSWIGTFLFAGTRGVTITSPKFSARTMQNDKLMVCGIMVGEGNTGQRGTVRIKGTTEFDGAHFGILAWAYDSFVMDDVIGDHWGQLDLANYGAVPGHVLYFTPQGTEGSFTSVGDCYDFGSEVSGIDWTQGSTSYKFTAQNESVRVGNLYSLRGAGVLDINGNNVSVSSVFWKGDAGYKFTANKVMRLGVGLYDGAGRTVSTAQVNNVYLHLPSDCNDTIVFSEYGCNFVSFKNWTIRHDGTTQVNGLFAGIFNECVFDLHHIFPQTLSGNPTLISIQGGGDNNRITVQTDSPHWATMRVIENDKAGSTGNSAVIINKLGGDERRLSEGSMLTLSRSSARLTMAAGMTLTANGLIPDGANLIGLTTIVTVAAGTSNGLTGYRVGNATDDDLYGVRTGVAVGGNTGNASWTADGSGVRTAAENVIITAVGGTGFDGTGELLLVAHYFLAAPQNDLA